MVLKQLETKQNPSVSQPAPSARQSPGAAGPCCGRGAGSAARSSALPPPGPARRSAPLRRGRNSRARPAALAERARALLRNFRSGRQARGTGGVGLPARPASPAQPHGPTHRQVPQLRHHPGGGAASHPRPAWGRGFPSPPFRPGVTSPGRATAQPSTTPLTGRARHNRLRTGEVFQPSDHFGETPPDPLQQVHVFLVLGTMELDTVPQLGSPSRFFP
ncbi:uncharacterized protein [Patagioenas fasciata]|uniref:uncharacterized protein n=1 Tax=Patagioenas fasciata TaxID=372321 RepID=UPI003A995FFD